MSLLGTKSSSIGYTEAVEKIDDVKLFANYGDSDSNDCHCDEKECRYKINKQRVKI